MILFDTRLVKGSSVLEGAGEIQRERERVRSVDTAGLKLECKRMLDWCRTDIFHLLISGHLKFVIL
jgi:hypothetical protein